MSAYTIVSGILVSVVRPRWVLAKLMIQSQGIDLCSSSRSGSRRGACRSRTAGGRPSVALGLKLIEYLEPLIRMNKRNDRLLGYFGTAEGPQ